MHFTTRFRAPLIKKFSLISNNLYSNILFIFLSNTCDHDFYFFFTALSFVSLFFCVFHFKFKYNILGFYITLHSSSSIYFFFAYYPTFLWSFGRFCSTVTQNNNFSTSDFCTCISKKISSNSILCHKLYSILRVIL